MACAPKGRHDQALADRLVAGLPVIDVDAADDPRKKWSGHVIQ